MKGHAQMGYHYAITQNLVPNDYVSSASRVKDATPSIVAVAAYPVSAGRTVPALPTPEEREAFQGSFV